MGVPKFQQDIMKTYGLPPTAHSSRCMTVDMTAADRHWLGLCPHSAGMVQLAADISLDMTLRAQEFIRREFAHLGIKPDWDVVCHLDWSLRRTRSRGGRYTSRTRSYESETKRSHGARMSLAMGHRVPPSTASLERWANVKFSEYSHIAKDPEIGDFHGSWEDCLRVLILHEVAHGVQFTCSPSAAKKAGFEYLEHRAHLKLWQEIYRRLRVHFDFVKTTSAGVEELTVTSKEAA